MEKECSKCNEIKDLSNFVKNKLGKFGVYSICKKCQSTYRKTNSEKLKARQRERYRKNNPPKEKVVRDIEIVLAKRKETDKAWKERNKDKVRLYSKNYRIKNREKEIIRNKKYREENKDKIKVKNKEWAKKNPEKIKLYYEKRDKKLIYKYQKEKRKKDKKFKIAYLLRIRLNSSLKFSKTGKNNKTMDYVGCSKEELVKYLESKFTNGMSWENQGYYGWHIDHIKPLRSFDLTKEEEIYKAMNYTNLQPLWRTDNQSKGGKNK